MKCFNSLSFNTDKDGEESEKENDIEEELKKNTNNSCIKCFGPLKDNCLKC